MVKFDVLHDLVVDWAAQRRIIPNSTPLAQASKTIEEVAEFGKKAALAFAAAAAAAGAYAVKLAVDGVKAAIEDEKAQESLRRTLVNVTSATEAQVAATEDFIEKTALATGVADDQLEVDLSHSLQVVNGCHQVLEVCLT